MSPEKFYTHRRNPGQLTTNANGRFERVVQTIKYEALLKFMIFGKRHLDYLVSEFVDYYNHRRSHMERDWLLFCLPRIRWPSSSNNATRFFVPGIV